MPRAKPGPSDRREKPEQGRPSEVWPWRSPTTEQGLGIQTRKTVFPLHQGRLLSSPATLDGGAGGNWRSPQGLLPGERGQHGPGKEAQGFHARKALVVPRLVPLPHPENLLLII